MTWLNIQLIYCSQEDYLFIFTQEAFVNSSCIFLNFIYFSSYLYQRDYRQEVISHSMMLSVSQFILNPHKRICIYTA